MLLKEQKIACNKEELMGLYKAIRDGPFS